MAGDCTEPPGPPGRADTGAAMAAERPRHILPVIVLSQFAGASLWFSAQALLPQLQGEFALGAQALPALTSAVQLGFIAGTLLFAVLSLADRFAARRVFLACALAGALANAAMLVLPHGPGALPALLALRFATGFFLAGIYPVGMKIASGWWREGLGRALGWLVGALVLGTALPHGLRALGQALPWTWVAGGVSLLAAAGGWLMFALVPDGPYRRPAARLDPRAVLNAFASPDFRSSALGYFGHMWELYTFWAFLPVWMAAYAAERAQPLDVALWSFLVIGAGALGCIGGGALSARRGSARVASAQISTSGLCCLLSPLAWLLPPVGFLAFLLVWGVTVAGDSPQFSALNATHAPPAYVGSALTLVNCIGFGLTVPSVQLQAVLAAHLPAPAWFVPLAVGPALGWLALRRLVGAARGATAPSRP